MSKKTLCIFAYHEKSWEYYNNLMYFLKYGINDRSDYVFVINGETTYDMSCLESSGVRVIRRENKGYDFAAYSCALECMDSERGKDWMSEIPVVFFLNSSVRGPFLLNCLRPWQCYFEEMLTGDTHLVGTTINVHMGQFVYLDMLGFKVPFTHVQSQMFAMSGSCLKRLRKETDVFNLHENLTYGQLIEFKEVFMSQVVLRVFNWNIDCLLPKYRGLDYRKVTENFNPATLIGDSYHPNLYFGTTFTPFDVVFIKTNRDLLDLSVDDRFKELEESKKSGESKTVSQFSLIDAT